VSDIFSIPLKTITGEPTTLAAWKGKTLLIVNVASKCGLTPQYTALEALYRRFKDKGLVILGFPANDFAGQEPGTEADIQTFCSTTYDVTFPMFAKVKVTGADKHPLYAALIAAIDKPEAKPDSGFRDMLKGHGITPTDEPEILWNFEKFLIGSDGKVAKRLAPEIAPDDEVLVKAVEALVG